MNAHNAPQQMMLSDYDINDPGALGTITIDRQLAIVEMVSTAAQARTLANPDKPGLRLCIRMKTAGGDITLTAAHGLNVTGNTVATFADVGDQLDLISVSHSTGFRWEILVNTHITLSS